MRESLKAFSAAVIMLVMLALALAMAPANAEVAANGLSLTSGSQPYGGEITGDRDDVIAIDVTWVSDAMWDDLLDMGYVGNPNDSREMLYPVRAAAIDACATDRDCFLAGNMIPHVDDVPSYAPSGALYVDSWEDGSAIYTDGTVFDPDTRTFR